MKLFDFDHPFFQPLWRRIAIVALCFGWAIVEFAVSSPIWGVIFAGIGLVAAWHFFRPDR